MKLSSLVIVISLVLFSCSVKNPIPSNQWISADKAQVLIERNDVVFVDCRPEQSYKDGHIPGAISITRDDIEDKNYPYGGMKIDQISLEKLLSDKGVSSTDFLLLYDDRGGCEATRLIYILHEYGFKNAAVIDGGLISWKEKNFDVTNVINPREKGKFNFSNMKVDTWHAEYADVINHSGENQIILDCRTKEEYDGSRLKSGAFLKGRIEGALWLDFVANIDEGNSKCFTDTNDLRKLYTERGITPDKDIIVYCQSGVRSSHTTFILKNLLGYKNVRNYDGSWIEYSFKNQSDSLFINN